MFVHSLVEINRVLVSIAITWGVEQSCQRHNMLSNSILFGVNPSILGVLLLGKLRATLLSARRIWSMDVWSVLVGGWV